MNEHASSSGYLLIFSNHCSCLSIDAIDIIFSLLLCSCSCGRTEENTFFFLCCNFICLEVVD